jgi:DNA-binding NarL/FixJ family response regulator
MKIDKDRQIKVLVVDDHPVVVHGIVTLLAGEPQINVVGAVANGAECLIFTQDASPDVILLDINLPDYCGLGLIEKIKDINPQVKIILMTGQDPRPYVKIAMQKRADRFLAKDCNSYEIVRAVFEVSGRKPPSYQEYDNSKNVLTMREKEIMNMIAKGMQNKEIAQQLNIKTRTVDCHVSNIFKKMGAETRLDAVLRWMKMFSA